MIRRFLNYLLACTCMKEPRGLSKIVAVMLGIGGLSAMTARESQKPVLEKAPTILPEEKEVHPELDPVFVAEHPMEAELLKCHVEQESIQASFTEAGELIRSHRYGDSVNEKKYFDACRTPEQWEPIQKSIQFASEKTGVPEQVLIAMGFIESKFDESAERKDTHVYGPYQMTLETAQEAAKDARACFGFPIEVTSVEDLKETKTAVRLAALRLRSLTKQYGQLGLAIIDYDSGRVELEHKIKEAFPAIDLG